MKYAWSVSFSLPGERRARRIINLSKSWEGKEYLKGIEKNLYDVIIAILGKDYVQATKKPDIRLTVICNSEKPERKLANKMRSNLLERITKTTKQLELF